ncbi:MAG: lytic transglycosylase F [Gemmatimonadetes bacterium]|nr:MAG: lytic transglycosylase F [Gemmatimonadota bacterium]
MEAQMIRNVLASAFIIIAILALSEPKQETTSSPPHVQIDLPEIQARGELIGITGYSATSYFIYKGQVMGYDYEMLNILAEHLGVKLKIVIVKNLSEAIHKLNTGEGDIIAANLTVTKERAKRIQFTDRLLTSRQVLVQRKPDGWEQMREYELERKLIRSPIDLIGKTVYVKRGSAFETRLKTLSEEIGGDINIQYAPDSASVEDLIRQVSEGVIDYTVTDENIAYINQGYYTNIDAATPVSLEQQIAWGVRKNAPVLLDSINAWLARNRRTTLYNVVYNKYYKNRRAFRQRLDSDYFAKISGRISKYDDLLKAKADELRWDWRLLAAQIYQESQFNPNARSWAGATGLMQLMPRTGRKFGARDLWDPRQNITAGTNFLKWLTAYWAESIPDSTERLKFVLASYNAGVGHVEDARRLAIKYGKNPNVWENNVSYFLQLKSKEAYYNDDVVEYGYCRGEEPVNYVDQILNRYVHYAELIE